MDLSFGYGALGSLPRIRDCRARRASSYNRSGGNADFVRLAPSETKAFAELPGAGVVRHLWFGGGSNEEHYHRKLLLRIYCMPAAASAFRGSRPDGGAKGMTWCSWMMRSSVYRFHIQDPIPFRHRIMLTCEHGHGNDRSDDWSSVAYWYQVEPHAPFPPMLPVADRLPR